MSKFDLTNSSLFEIFLKSNILGISSVESGVYHLVKHSLGDLISRGLVRIGLI